MYIFWFIISGLTLLALAFILKPLLSVKGQEIGTKPSLLMALILALSVPALAIPFYLHFGHSQLTLKWLADNANKEVVKKEIARYGSKQNIISALRAKLEQLPDNESSAKGWYILGKLYFNENNPAEAVRALEHAVNLKPNDPDYLLQLVSARFYFYQKLTDQDQRLIQRLLRLEPGNVNAINLLALDAYQQHKFEEAIHHWEILLQYFPAESEDSKGLLNMIRLARSQATAPLVSSKKIKVALTISDSLKMKITPNDVLFVYAMEASGSRMPLAVVRLSPKRFPQQVILSSDQSMLPGRSIANANKVYIVARISKTGNALPTKGDFVGESKLLMLNKEGNTTTLCIDHVFYSNSKK